MSGFGSAEQRLARSEAKVAALTEALERRSGQLRALQPLLSRAQLLAWARISAGLPVTSLAELEHPFAVDSWRETPQMAPADVTEALTALWKSIEEDGLE